MASMLIEGYLRVSYRVSYRRWILGIKTRVYVLLFIKFINDRSMKVVERAKAEAKRRKIKSVEVNISYSSSSRVEELQIPPQIFTSMEIFR